MDGNAYRVEPAPEGEYGWLVIGIHNSVLLHCTNRDDADRIAVALTLRVDEENLLGNLDSRGQPPGRPTG